VAALAEVKSTKPLSESQLRDYEREQPIYEPDDEAPANEGMPEHADSGYVFNAHALTPFAGYLSGTGNRIYIADFTTIQTYSGSIGDFQAARVAGMSPVGRRLLRIRLALFWGRAEDEDRKWLIEHDVPVGETPPLRIDETPPALSE
jgi:hypothetical protein